VLGPAQGALANEPIFEETLTPKASTYTQFSPTQLSSNPNLLQDQLVADPQLPKYIRPVPLEMNPEDLGILAGKWVFRMPDITVRNELLRKYAEYVHPLLPLLDLREFLQAIDSDDGHIQLSLMLFYAVMSAAAAYVDIRHLHAEGFVNRKAARKAFFQKAKVRFGRPGILHKVRKLIYPVIV
jgi:hypothetical protein